MSTGNILFIEGSSWVSKLIQKIDGPYSHVAIRLGERTYFESQRYVNSRITNEPIKDACTEFYLDLDAYQKEMVVKSAFRLVDTPYDYKQIFSILWHRLTKRPIKNRRTHLICSESVATILYECGYLTREEFLQAESMTPNELYKMLAEK